MDIFRVSRYILTLKGLEDRAEVLGMAFAEMIEHWEIDRPPGFSSLALTDAEIDELEALAETIVGGMTRRSSRLVASATGGECGDSSVKTKK